tara:strand:+ start:184 stop:342 length:159 start_codon:yes stop_codon:yes gene_type:complete
MEAPKFNPMIRAQKRLAEIKKRQKQQEEFGTPLGETFERADDEITPRVEEQE